MTAFALHLDDLYLWRWYCFDEVGKALAQSSQAYFNLTDAKASLKRFRQSNNDNNL